MEWWILCFEAVRTHLSLSFTLQSNTAVSIMAARAGETWHPHCGGSGCISGLYLHHCYLLFSGPEEWTCTNKPSRSEIHRWIKCHIYLCQILHIKWVRITNYNCLCNSYFQTSPLFFLVCVLSYANQLLMLASYLIEIWEWCQSCLHQKANKACLLKCQTIPLEPIYMSLTAQRNLGVPLRHAERRAAGRTYENR